MLSFQAVSSALPERVGRLYVAYSGGVDSHVLLHLCARQPDWQAKLCGVYVDHRLQAESTAWGTHCRRQCEALGVEFLLLTVDASAAPGESPEAAARRARYAALADLLDRDDVVLAAQHREDQLETVLLQLFRGAGVAGLAAMPRISPLGRGSLVRPLLKVGKAEVLVYARQQGLVWIEDPSNATNDFDRNFLRNQVLPLLKQRWPGLDKTVARSAELCGEAAECLDEWAEAQLAAVSGLDRGELAIDQLPVAASRRRLLIRQWLARNGLRPPSRAITEAILAQVVDARGDANPQLCYQGALIRRYRKRLVCVPAHPAVRTHGEVVWPDNAQQIELGGGCRLSKEVSVDGIAQALWDRASVTVRFRRGGEKLKLPGRGGRHSLKKLYQAAGTPPWEREWRPLIYLDGRLAAVAGLWVAEWVSGSKNEPCYRVSWQFRQSV
ncbi:tRNA lysidine(34) synthetase TilS [Methylococcaceae bacterium WWC4]|nr:tRNA lysidine(34) synthetase TilS [Methylococcaceae bacterium WWC4]